jgi:hypothetical protein
MNHWDLPPDIFARRISINDLPGYFSKQLTIHSGVRTAIVDDGRDIGEVPPGTYVLESFKERLQRWWQAKQCDVISVRSEQQILEINSAPVLTADCLLVQYRTRVAVQLDDVMIFHRNLMGNRTEFTVQQLHAHIAALLTDFISSYMKSLPLEGLRAPDATQKLDAWLAEQLAVYMKRFGLAFRQVLTLSIVHPEYDAELKRRGETKLREMASETDRRNDRIAAEEAWQKVLRQDRDQQVEAAYAELQIERETHELRVMRLRVQIRKGLRSAVLSDRMDKLNTAAELENFVRELDREKLLEDDELQQLKDTVQQDAEDRAALRKHLLERIAIEQKLDLDMLLDDCAHQRQMQRRKSELELARLAETEADRQWSRQLQRDVENAEHQRNEEWKKWQHKVRKFRSYRQEKRAEEIESLLHESRQDQLLGDVELQQAERRNRIRDLENQGELRNKLSDIDRRRAEEDFKHEIERKKAESDLEFQQKKADAEHQQAQRSAELQAAIAAGQLQGDLARVAMQQLTLKSMQDHERLDREQREKNVMEADRQRREWENFVKNEDHKRWMEYQRFVAGIEEAKRRDTQAHQLDLERLKNERFRDAKGASIETLIFGAPEVAGSLVQVAAQREETSRHTATMDADVKKAEAQQTTAVVTAQVAGQNAQQTAEAVQKIVTDTTKTILQTVQDATQQTLAAKDQHIKSSEAASDKRDESVQKTLDKMLQVVVDVRRPADQPSAATATPPSPAAPAAAPVVVINQVPPQAPPTASSPQPAPEQVRRCPTCFQSVSPTARFCEHCGRMQ